MIAPVALGAGIAAAGLWGAYDPNSPVYGPVIGRGPKERVVYLTFDDGPNPSVTEWILKTLRRAGVPATFFMLGSYVEEYPGTALAVARAGHEIGNHTYSHAKLHRLSAARVAEEVDRAHQAIVHITGRVPCSFRAPHGYRGPFVSRAVGRYGYQVFGWTFGVRDSDCPGVEHIRWRVRARLRPGSIILLHDGDGYDPKGDRWQTAAALGDIIRDVRAAGYRFEPLSRLVPR
ncbi:MAG TPA: polysaccharide deacetylase family protein [Gemmatimonadales bacterium]|jgi:peptidoglycan/xylan/chitin deacetylase (PgdA/CDA1 family)|nr:polysaccharide deacetylase family protein [Gemmatimonadales bacterium]